MDKAFDKMSVLAVDDNRTNLHILQVFLRKLGHNVILAENGEQAVQRFLQESPDLVLLDIMMPIMDGFEAARRIKAASRDKWVPIIFLSALNRDENLVEGLEAGADDYLTKPINFVVLEAKLRSVQRSLALQQSAALALERVQAISDNVVDAIVTTSCSGEILSVNRATERIFARRPREMIGQPISFLLPSIAPAGENDQFLDQPCLLSRHKGRDREDIGARANGTFPVELGISEVSMDQERLFVCVVRDISERKKSEQQLQENARLLQAYYDHSTNEQQLAVRLMEKLLHRPGLSDPRLHYKVMATENFSGDIVAAARSPEGRFYALLADATGHGLPAAISVLPVLALFYRMTRMNRPVQELVFELNQQLKESMPVGRFVAATIICLDEKEQQGEIWIGGTPEAHLLNTQGQATSSFKSEHLALGIEESREADCIPVIFPWTGGSQLLVYSDGLLEAADHDGRQFGVDGVLHAVAGHHGKRCFEKLEQALTAHLGEESATDDVSVMLITSP